MSMTCGRRSPSCAAGASSTASTTITVPSTLAPGTYYIGAIADYTGVQPEANETNNAMAAAATVTVNSGVAQAYYIHTDQLDTPRVITDTNGNVVWRWDNADPFGANMANENPNGAGQFSFNLRFPGQYYDRETNLHYNVNRDYDPAIGRYIESDPIGLGGGINTYAYVGGNPLSFVDPRGLDVTMTCRPLSLAPPGPAVHCSVVVWHLDACSNKKVIVAQYSLAGGDTSPTTKPENDTFTNDTKAFNNSGGWNANYPIPVPPGETSQQFDQNVIKSGNSYTAPYYDFTGQFGPNSNSAANRIIEDAGGTTPNVWNAAGQNWWDNLKNSNSDPVFP